jgi:hypothetical protein
MTTYCPNCPTDMNGSRRPLLLDGGTKCHGCGWSRTHKAFPDRPLCVNDYPVIRAVGVPGGEGGRDGWLILVDRGEGASRHGRYVTAMLYGDDESWNIGVYCISLEEAHKSFAERARRQVGV